jgi:hypothetical protein
LPPPAFVLAARPVVVLPEIEEGINGKITKVKDTHMFDRPPGA